VHNLGSIEYAGLVHVVPDVEVGGGAQVLGELELGAPPGDRLGVHHVDVHRRPGPAPPAGIVTFVEIRLAHPHSSVVRILGKAEGMKLGPLALLEFGG